MHISLVLFPDEPFRNYRVAEDEYGVDVLFSLDEVAALLHQSLEDRDSYPTQIVPQSAPLTNITKKSRVSGLGLEPSA